jgi:hypothetical protein
VFPPDRMPAYISWEQYERNRAQLHANLPAQMGSPRAGSALLSGLLTCGRCGLRMTAVYNNNGHAARYVCHRMHADYGEPFCQSLKAAPLDATIARLVLQALEPAAIEASIVVANDLEAERATLEHHWQQRRERARYAVGRGRRQYDTVEPENRLVARTLEQAWEQALTDQSQVEAEYERFRRERPQTPGAAEMAMIRNLALDLPKVWNGETTTQADRQTIVRLLLERILVEVVKASEQVRLECHWHGGTRTTQMLVRPVARAKALSTYPALVARATELHQSGNDCAKVAAILNQEAWRPAKRRDTFNAQMVRHLLTTAGVIEPSPRRPRKLPDRQPDEWTIRELAEKLSVPQATVYSWVQNGRLCSRSVNAGGGSAKLVTADAATIVNLKAIRATPLPWRRLPQSVTETKPSLDS